MKPLINDAMTLGEVTLKVQNLEQSIDYYSRIIGLSLISNDSTSAILGVGITPLIHLIADAKYQRPQAAYTGLYHIAFLLPTEAALGQILYHFARENYEIDGAGDHIYSQALYMHDPDGNGIEIYADRPRDTWIINADGTIESGTEPVDIQRLVDMVQVESWHGLPDHTIIGHMHLQVKDLKAHEAFYVDLLGFDVKTVWGNTALFISKNGYHHHIGANTWAHPFDVLPHDVTGLASYTLLINNLEELKANLDGYSLIDGDDHAIKIIDPNGITLILRQH